MSNTNNKKGRSEDVSLFQSIDAKEYVVNLSHKEHQELDLLRRQFEDELARDKEHPVRLLIWQEARSRQQDLITDPFMLFAIVMRKRVKRIAQGHDIFWDTLMRKKNVQLLCFSLLGLFCNIVIASVLWYNDKVIVTADGITVYSDTNTSEEQGNTARYSVLVMLQIALTTSTFVCVILLIQRAHMYAQEKRHMWSGIDMLRFTKLMLRDEDAEGKKEVADDLESSYSLWKSSHKYRLALEIVLHLLHPWIWLNEPGTKSFFRVLQVIIFVRLYLVGNIVFILSEAYKSRVEILNSNVELQGAGQGVTAGLTFKMMYFSHPVLFTTALTMGTLVVLGFIMFLAERTVQPQNSSFGSLQNAYWFSFVTFTTTGYGDLVPISSFGKFVSVLIGASGILLMTLLSGVITNLAAASREQRFVQDYLVRAKSASNCRDASARVIQAAYRYYRLKNNQLLMPWLKRGGDRTNFLLGCVKEFQEARWNFSKSISSASDPVVDSKINFIKTDLVTVSNMLDDHEKSITATLDNLQQRVSDILNILDGK